MLALNVRNIPVSKDDSEFVCVAETVSPKGSFNIAKDGDYLVHLGGDFYKCKRLIAERLSLGIISEYPIKRK